MSKSNAEKVRETEARHRARGEREIRLWVPDDPETIEAVRRLARELCKEFTDRA